MSDFQSIIANNDADGLVKLMCKHVAIIAGDATTAAGLAEPYAVERYESVKHLLTKAVGVATSNIVAATKEQASRAAKSVDVGEPLLSIPDISFMEPRGRFKLTISTTSIVLEGKSQSFIYPVSKISHLCCVPSNASVKKEGEDFLSVRFADIIPNNGKECRGLLCTMGKNVSKQISAVDGDMGIETDIITKVLQSISPSGVALVRPQNILFLSILQRKTFLRCYRGTQEGVIYPLENGVLFVKPLLFIPAEDIAALSAGRGGSAGSTRYVDLTIDCVSGPQYEFTNIDRDELPALQLYVKGYLEALQRNRINSNSASSKGAGEESGDESARDDEQEERDEEEEDDSDDDDSDFDPDASDSESGNDSDSDSSGDDGDIHAMVAKKLNSSKKKKSRKEKKKLKKRKKKEEKMLNKKGKRREEPKRKKAMNLKATSEQESGHGEEDKVGEDGTRDGKKRKGKNAGEQEAEIKKIKVENQSVIQAGGEHGSPGDSGCDGELFVVEKPEASVASIPPTSAPINDSINAISSYQEFHSVPKAMLGAVSSSNTPNSVVLPSESSSKPEKENAAVVSTANETVVPTVSDNIDVPLKTAAPTPVAPAASASAAPTAPEPVTASSTNTSSKGIPGAAAPRQKTLQSFFGGGGGGAK